MSNEEKGRRSFSLVHALGILFALLLCLVSSAMVAVAVPASSPLLRIFLDADHDFVLALQNDQDLSATPTPFQPIAIPTADTPIPAPELTLTPTPTPEAEPPATPGQPPAALVPPEYPDGPPPASASISGVRGSPQLYTLDCESQAAVDWARFFGTSISHQEFIDRLPRSDDPEEGFVGHINGAMGQIPPNAYGVHAPPVAALLREYGLPAVAVRDWDFEKIQHEIAAGRPVIVWIVNLPYEIETYAYTASSGNTTQVARFQHTWVITAYNASSVTVVDSQWTYNVRLPTFLQRWEALQKQAVIFVAD